MERIAAVYAKPESTVQLRSIASSFAMYDDWHEPSAGDTVSFDGSVDDKRFEVDVEIENRKTATQQRNNLACSSHCISHMHPHPIQTSIRWHRETKITLI